MPPPPRKPKAKGPPRATEEALAARAHGALLGLAAGEALGVHLEGRQLVAAHFPQLNDGPHTDFRGGGTRALKAGQVSWGTEMACCLSEALRTGFDLEAVAKRYARWLGDANEPPEPVKRALELVLEGRAPEYVGRQLWLESGQALKDNAALVRTTPIGVHLARHRDERIRLCLEDTALTHFAPVCRLASVIVNAVVAAAVTSPKERAEKADLVKAIEADLSVAAATLARREPEWVVAVRDAAGWLREDVTAAQAADPLLFGPELHLFWSPTWARVTLRLALWELFHAPSLEAGVIDAANRGGDAAVNASVTGALLGAVHGEAALPARWREGLLEAPGPSGGPHWNAYHPRFLLALAPRP